MSVCILCKSDILAKNTMVCGNCWSNIKFLSKTNNTINAVVEYNSTIRQLIHIFKYNSPWMLCDLFMNWISLMYKELIQNSEIIIPIPMHKYKLMSRGYNQAAVLAKRLSQTYEKKCIVNGIIRTKNSVSQSLLKREERLLNIENAFMINSAKIHLLQNKKILLIDDVTTTGATLTECIKVLNQANIVNVKALCIAMTSN